MQGNAQLKHTHTGKSRTCPSCPVSLLLLGFQGGLPTPFPSLTTPPSKWLNSTSIVWTQKQANCLLAANDTRIFFQVPWNNFVVFSSMLFIFATVPFKCQINLLKIRVFYLIILKISYKTRHILLGREILYEKKGKLYKTAGAEGQEAYQNLCFSKHCWNPSK